VAELPEERAAAPVVHQGVVGGVLGPQVAALPAPPPPARAEAARRAEAFMAKEADASLRDQATSSLAVATQGRELGDLFEYRFDKPVTVKKNESAMLPFLQQKLNARKLLVYSDHSSQHPLNAAELTNSTGKTLDGGPITVYDSNAYAGEALMETTKASDKRLISYGIDLGTRITTKIDSDAQNYREVHMRRGILTAKSARIETKTFTIRNVDAKAKTLILEMPIRPGYKVLNQKPSETTANAYRFEVKLPASGTEQFPVREEYIFDQSLAVANLTPDFLISLVQNRQLSEPARAQLQKIVDKKRQIAGTDRDAAQVQRQIDELFKDQERLRQNLSSLNQVAGQQGQVQKYASQLSAQELKLTALRDRAEELRKLKDSQAAELATLIESMDF
jgi:hypothetical protein